MFILCLYLYLRLVKKDDDYENSDYIKYFTLMYLVSYITLWFFTKYGMNISIQSGGGLDVKEIHLNQGGYDTSFEQFNTGRPTF